MAASVIVPETAAPAEGAENDTVGTVVSGVGVGVGVGDGEGVGDGDDDPPDAVVIATISDALNARLYTRTSSMVPLNASVKPPFMPMRAGVSY